MKLKITAAHTFLKAIPAQSSEIRDRGLPNQLVEVRRGDEFEIVDHHPYAGAGASANDDHVFIQLAKPLPKCAGLRWFVHGMHSKVEGTEPGNNPKDEPASPNPAKGYGPLIALPGISRDVGVYEPVYFEPSPSNFTWAELTKGGARIPVTAEITGRLVRLAKYLDQVREFLGSRPMTITSGYRDPKTNRRVGGARRSRHLMGDAVDFRVVGENVVDTFGKLKPFHKTGGLAVGNGFVHLDMRPGAPARWTYPGGPRVSLW